MVSHIGAGRIAGEPLARGCDDGMRGCWHWLAPKRSYFRYSMLDDPIAILLPGDLDRPNCTKLGRNVRPMIARWLVDFCISSRGFASLVAQTNPLQLPKSTAAKAPRASANPLGAKNVPPFDQHGRQMLPVFESMATFISTPAMLRRARRTCLGKSPLFLPAAPISLTRAVRKSRSKYEVHPSVTSAPSPIRLGANRPWLLAHKLVQKYPVEVSFAYTALFS